MSIMVFPMISFVEVLEKLDSNKIYPQFEFLKKELKKTLEELNTQIEKYNYKFVEDSDLDHIYELLDLQKENLKKLSKTFKNSNLFNLIDEIYTLTLQIEDRISTLESYKDIEALKANS